MNKQQIKAQLEAAEAEKAVLLQNQKDNEAKIAELKKQLDGCVGVDKPEYGRIYHVIRHNGDGLKIEWQNDCIDDARFAFGNCYLTEKHCDRAIALVKVINKIEQFKEQNDSDGEEEYFIFPYRRSNKATVYFSDTLNGIGSGFSTQKLAEQCLEFIQDAVNEYLEVVKR